MAKTQSWEVSDELWQKVQPLVPLPPSRPTRQRFRRRPGGGRKPLENRQIFAGIVYVLRTGCQWKALPKSFGSASSVHKHFQRWRGGDFSWHYGRLVWPSMTTWKGLPGSGKALMGRKAKRPWRRKRWATTPRIGEKKGSKRSLLVDGAGVPLSLIVSGANRQRQ